MVLMQENDKILYLAIGKVLRDVRKKTGQKFTIFCYENDIPTSSLNALENGLSQAYFSKIFKVVKALGITMEEFSALLEKELPKDFLNPDNR